MIRLELPEHIVDARIKGSTMDGIFTLGDGQRSIWNAQRVWATHVKPPTSKIDSEPNPKPIRLGDHQKRGDQRLRSKDYQGAISDYSKVIQRCVAEGVAISDDGLFCYQFFSTAYLSRGKAKFKLNDKVGACEDFRKACKMGDSDACKIIEVVCN